MNLWSDIMVELIEDIKNNPIAYYIGLLVGIAMLIFVITLIVKNERRKKDKIKEQDEERARIERHVDLESMIAKMQEQEQSKLKDTDPVANFEQEQEEKAIISYQELVNAVKTDKKESINVTSVTSTGDVISTTTIPRETLAEDKPIFIDEIKLPKKEIEFDPQEEVIIEPQVKEETRETVSAINNIDSENSIQSFESLFTSPAVDDKTKYEEKAIVKETDYMKEKDHNKFRNSEFISPIYGRQNSNITYPKISSYAKEEKDDDIINISSDVDPNTEFLKTLREYRND